MAVRRTSFEVEITLEDGRLRERLKDEDDRQLMINRLEKILNGDPGYSAAVRSGTIQILVDQFKNEDSHVPIILHTGTVAGDDEEDIDWHCDLLAPAQNFYVDVHEYPKRSNPNDNPFKFSGAGKGTGQRNNPAKANGYKSAPSAQSQMFFKFVVEAGLDLQGNPRVLDPCIICGR